MSIQSVRRSQSLYHLLDISLIGDPSIFCALGKVPDLPDEDAEGLARVVVGNAEVKAAEVVFRKYLERNIGFIQLFPSPRKL